MGFLEAIRWCGQVCLDVEDQCLSWASLGGLCQRIPSSLPVSAPLSPSLPLSSRQDDEALASSSPLIEQHACSEGSSATQGPKPTQDISLDLDPESASSFSGASDSPSQLLPTFDESDSVSSPQFSEQQPSFRELPMGQGPEQPQETTKDAVLVPGITSSLLLANAVPVFGCGEGSYGKPEGALPGERGSSLSGEEGPGSGRSQEIVLAEPSGAERERFSEGEEGAGSGRSQGSETSEGACLFEKLDGGCLFQILSHMDSSSLNTASLVCCEWLEMARDVRQTLEVRNLVHCTALPYSLARFPRLQTLTVTEGAAKYCFGDRHMRDIALKAPQLRRLDVGDCKDLTDAGLAAVLRGCSNLQTLNLIRCNGFSGAAFEGVRCKLFDIKLEECKGLTNQGLVVLAAACPVLGNFTLRRLKGDGYLAGGLEALAQQCKSLGRLNLRGAGTTDACLGAFARNCRKLDMVSISREPAITDGGVATLIERLPVLQRLSLTDNRGLTVVPRSRPGAPLKLLGLSWWLTISDEGLRQVSQETSLEELHLYNCPALTDATVGKVLVSCRSLKRLVVAQCALLTPRILTSYVESGSKARVLVAGCEGVPKSALSEDNRHLGKLVIEDATSVLG